MPLNIPCSFPHCLPTCCKADTATNLPALKWGVFDERGDQFLAGLFDTEAEADMYCSEHGFYDEVEEFYIAPAKRVNDTFEPVGGY